MRMRGIWLLAAAWLIFSPPIATLAQTGLPAADRELARDIFRQLVEIPTTQADAATTRAAQVLADRLRAAGFPPDDIHVLEPGPRTGSFVARLRARDGRLRPILLMAHLDVVPARREDWSRDPWKFTETDGWFYGRGTSDNKFGAALLVANLIRLKREGWEPQRDVVIALTGDEETTSDSIQWLLDRHRELVDAEIAFNTDAGSLLLKNGRPSLFTVQASEKVYMDLALEATDKGGHSSLPAPGNPIYNLSSALVRIADYKFPVNITDVARLFFERSALVGKGQLASDLRAISDGRGNSDALARVSTIPFYNARLRTTCVATRVEAGHANNALPQLARGIVNCRILPGESPAGIEAKIRQLAGKDVQVTLVDPPVSSPPSPVGGEVLHTLERLVAEQWPGVPLSPTMEAGATDGLYVRRAGIPTYGVSAMSTDPDDVRAHGKDERVSVEGFYQTTEFWYRLIRAFAGR
jgi:acetylornithine deacetylase/succinyl-diaminopimelate desuccinylase-like protein